MHRVAARESGQPHAHGRCPTGRHRRDTYTSTLSVVDLQWDECERTLPTAGLELGSIEVKAGILPGLLLLAMVQSRYEAIRLPGWAVLFLWAAFLVYVAPRLLY